VDEGGFKKQQLSFRSIDVRNCDVRAIDVGTLIAAPKKWNLNSAKKNWRNSFWKKNPAFRFIKSRKFRC